MRKMLLAFVLTSLCGLTSANSEELDYQIELRYVTTTEEIVRQLQLTSFATAPAQPDPKDFELVDKVELPESQKAYVAVSRSVVETRPPVCVEQITEQQARLLVTSMQENRDSNIMMAPKVRLLEGQTGHIETSVQRPFVTGLVPGAPGSDITQLQPIVQVFSEGTRFTLRVRSLKEQGRRLDCRVEQSSIRKVNEASTGNGASIVQVPELARNEMEFATRFDDDLTLFVWWPETRTAEPQPSGIMRVSGVFGAAPRNVNRMIGILIRVEPRKRLESETEQ